jgi:hypothetical protein
MADDAVKSVVVTAVASSVNSHRFGRRLALRIEQAMADEVLKCNAEGISTDEQNSDVIRRRVLMARQREIDAIVAEQPGNPA